MSILKKTVTLDNHKNSGHQSEAETKTITNAYELDDYENKIVSLWNSGLSASVIAAEVGKNRNMIIGKLWRLRQKGVNLNDHARPKILKNPTSPKRPRETKPFGLPLFDFKPPKPLPEIKVLIDAKPKNIRFKDLKNNSCRYVVNDGPPETFIFCGAPKERGSYCEAHAVMCYVPSKPPVRRPHNPNAQQRYYR